MERGPDLRRIAPADLEAVESDPDLLARIRAEIGRFGPMTFARFMELALYDPEGGYYRSGTPRPGRTGDFLTAPEASPIFGRALARHVADVWRLLGEPVPFTIREFGAGGGALAAALIDGLARTSPALLGGLRYRPVEIEARRVDELRSRLAAQGPPLSDVPIEIDDGSRIVGVVLANEVLDALPVHRVVQRGERLREISVGLEGDELVDVEREPSTPELAARLDAEGVCLADGQVAEIGLALDGWIAALAAGLERGLALLIDYGHPAAELYDPVRRPAGTLLAYLRHTAHDDVYRAVGRQDLTAHVDVTAVERAAARSGLDHLATVRQGRFLEGLGAGELLVEMQGGPSPATPATLATYLEARSSLVRMIDPAAMGGFRVMAFGRGLPAGVLPRGLA
jgi:SAM-dependent MidA family methyltransferase